MTVEYRGYEIKPKQDFGTQGHLIKGEMVRNGFNVVKNGCNIMPGATWFRNVIDAKEAIDAYILADSNANIFWLLMHNGGGNTVENGEHSGTVTVKPADHLPISYARGQVYSATLGQTLTAHEALALAAAIRQAALYALGDRTHSVR